MIGKTVSHYKIIEKVGEGGMGAVYKAEDVKLKRTVALKFISPQAAVSSEQRTRFVREAQVVASLDHPNICTMYEIDDIEGQMFIAMAYIKGKTLEEKIKSGPLKLEEALEIAMQVSEGLKEAHEKGIVHRDIKSANVMLTEKGQAKIMDFGIAKFAERTNLTKTATIMGTVEYMSPEQTLGEAVDHRTDIWSLGVVLYEMITGQLPFKGEYSQVVFHSILNKPPQPITSLRSGIPLQLEAIADKCLEKDPSERYQTVADLIADLKRLKRDVTTGKATYTPAIAKKTHRPSLLVKAFLPLSLAVIAFILVSILPSSRQKMKMWLGIKPIFGQKHLVVMPFSIVGRSETDRAFCDGLAESLSSKLGQLENYKKSLWTAPQSDILRHEIKSPKEAGQFLGVNLAVTGNMKRISDVIILTMNLVEAKTERPLSSQNITDHVANISTFQDNLIVNLADMLKIKVEPQILHELSLSGTTVPRAFDFYLQARGYLLDTGKEGNIERAVDLFQKAIEQDSSYAQAYAGLGEAFWKKFIQTTNPEWVGQAQSYLNRSILIDDQLASPHISLGLLYRRTGLYEKAISEYQRALQLDPKNFEAAAGLALSYEGQGNLEKAEEIYKDAIKLKDDYWKGYGDLGFFYYFQGRYAEAEKFFLRSAELAPGNILILNNLGATYIKLGKSEQATAVFEKSLSIKPNADACSNLAHIYFYQGRYADAMTRNEEAIELGENEWKTWGNLGDSYRFTPGYSEKALEAYQHAIQLAEEKLLAEPSDAHLHASLALYLAKSGEYEKALTEISEAHKLKPKDIIILLDSIVVFELSGERARAVSALEEYIERGGPLEEIKKDPFLSDFRTDERYLKLIRRESSTQTDS
jgi:serine/threonine-protein kinase